MLKDGKEAANGNFTLAWEVGNVEKYVDALLAGFDTAPFATLMQQEIIMSLVSD